MRLEIVEHEDRWVILPLRNLHVLGVVWQAEEVELVLGGDFRLVFGYDAELSARSSGERYSGRRPIVDWDRNQAEDLLRSEILSPVFFKSGGVRLAFRNGLILSLPDRPVRTPTILYVGLSALWTHRGISTEVEYPVRRVDPWTGDLVTTPEWPARPPDLDIDYESDDING